MKEFLTDLTIGGEVLPMRLLMNFKYQGDRYAAFTPEYSANSSDEEEIALARVLKNDDGKCYEVISNDDGDEIFAEFERRYEKKISGNKRSNGGIVEF